MQKTVDKPTEKFKMLEEYENIIEIRKIIF